MIAFSRMSRLALALGFAMFAAAVPAGAGPTIRLAQSAIDRKSATPTTTKKTYTFRACNHTGNTIAVAVSYIPVGQSDWRNMGWRIVETGACADIFTTQNTIFYARAEVKDDSSTAWGGDIQQCVAYPGPYDFTTRSEDTQCPEGDDAASFDTLTSTGSPVYEWDVGS